VAKIKGKVFPAPENYFGSRDEKYNELLQMGEEA